MQTEVSEIAPSRCDSAAVSALFRQGQDFLLRRNVRAAIGCFDSAQHLGYAAEECAAGRWDCWMLLGDFERAWRESDFISSAALGDPNCYWDGRPWNGRRVMLRCLHGLGDTIQFIRYAPLLKRTCRSLTVQTHPQLVTLLEGIPAIDRVCTWGPDYVENTSDWDMQMEVTELPRAFRTTFATIPAATPYIHPPKERIVWGASCIDSSENLRVGLAWEAGPWNPARCIHLDELGPFLSCQGCRFYSLQKGATLADVHGTAPMYDPEAQSADIRDTAGLILNLDLIVTVDTMTAHLAGALGRRVWILLPASADWRWMLERSDTPWYPSARLFRQHVPGDWRGVIEEVRDALAVEAQRYAEYQAVACRRAISEYQPPLRTNSA
jgi:hypothetical protein